MRWIALAAVFAASPAVAADQFDLVCSGGANPVRYRIDLDRKEACSESCERIWQMGPISSGELYIIDRKPAFFGDLLEQAVVNRVSGEFRYHTIVNGRTYRREGVCRAAEFTGFPTSQF